jgi:thioredoxin 1
MDEGRVAMNRMCAAVLLIGLLPASVVFAQSHNETPASFKKDSATVTRKPLITFIELGSVNCIPCKAMQPVMKAIEAKYGSQISVVFHDVWKKDQEHFVKEYGVRIIPTQVFLDAQGKEIKRHEGFFSEKEIDRFLQSQGLTVVSGQGK